MPLPDRLGQLNRWTINPVVRRIAGHIPMMAVVVHAGRTSGETYRTPVLAFRTIDGFVIALVYGADSDWVRNVLAAGSATLQHRGQDVPVTEPCRTGIGEVQRQIPAPIRAALRLLRVADVLVLREAGTT